MISLIFIQFLGSPNNNNKDSSFLGENVHHRRFFQSPDETSRLQQQRRIKFEERRRSSSSSENKASSNNDSLRLHRFELKTPLTGGNGGYGILFKLSAGITDSTGGSGGGGLSIDNLGLHIGSQSGDWAQYHVYIKPRPATPHLRDWTEIGGGLVRSQGFGRVTTLPWKNGDEDFVDNECGVCTFHKIHLTDGEDVMVYVTLETPDLVYSDTPDLPMAIPTSLLQQEEEGQSLLPKRTSRSSIATSVDGLLSIHSGIGLGTYPMMANDRFSFTNRDFNGVVYFSKLVEEENDNYDDDDDDSYDDDDDDDDLQLSRSSQKKKTKNPTLRNNNFADADAAAAIAAKEDDENNKNKNKKMEWIDHILRTELSGDVNCFGNFFDIHVKDDSIVEITGLSISAYESPHPLSAFVYTKHGSFSSNSEEEGEGGIDMGWIPIPLTNANVMGRGYTKDTLLRFVEPLSIPPNTLRGMYVTLTVAAMYTSSSYKPVGEIASQSEHLSILVGKSAQTPPHPMGIASGTPRIFNGRLDYRVWEAKDNIESLGGGSNNMARSIAGKMISKTMFLLPEGIRQKFQSSSTTSSSSSSSSVNNYKNGFFDEKVGRSINRGGGGGGNVNSNNAQEEASPPPDSVKHMSDTITMTKITGVTPATAAAADDSYSSSPVLLPPPFYYHHGNMFTITSHDTSNTLLITGINIPVRATFLKPLKGMSPPTYHVEVWVKHGTYDGYENNSVAWTRLVATGVTQPIHPSLSASTSDPAASAATLEAAIDAPVMISIPDFIPLVLQPQSTLSVHITFSTPDLNYAASDTTTSPVCTQGMISPDGLMSSSPGIGFLTFPFGWPEMSHPRCFAGEVEYGIVRRDMITTYETDNGSCGIMFDVKNLRKKGQQQQQQQPKQQTNNNNNKMFVEKINDDTGELLIHGLDVHIDTMEEIFIEVYMKPGSHTGFETQDKRSSWHLLLPQFSIRGSGLGRATSLPDFPDGPLLLPPGKRIAFYISTTSLNLRYTNVGPPSNGMYAGNSDLLVYKGSGIGSCDGLGFGGYGGGGFAARDETFVHKPRVFNGSIRYTVVHGPKMEGEVMVVDTAAAAGSSSLSSSSSSFVNGAEARNKGSPELQKEDASDDDVPPLALIAPIFDSPNGFPVIFTRAQLSIAGKNIEYGCMFDIQPKQQQPNGQEKIIRIHSLSIHVDTTDLFTVEVYTRPGTHVGYERSPEGWILLSRTMLKGYGLGKLTPIPSVSFQPILIDSRQGLYVTCRTSNIVYSDSQVGGYEKGYEMDVVTENDDLVLYEGSGLLSYPFAPLSFPSAAAAAAAADDNSAGNTVVAGDGGVVVGGGIGIGGEDASAFAAATTTFVNTIQKPQMFDGAVHYTVEERT